MSESNSFVGFWKILDCAPVAINIHPKGIQGTIFQLSQNGDVTWKIPSGAMPTPLFKCDTYEVVSGRSYMSSFILRFGAYKGHVIDCRVKACEPYLNTITINDGWCLLVCKKFEDLNYEDLIELPFSFIQALQDSYFSDLTLKAGNNKKFCVHTCILKLGAPDVDWSSKNNPLSKLPEDIASAILHFLYAQCLPEGLDEGAVNRILRAASEIQGLEALVSMCQSYVRNVTLKKRIFTLISDMHACASQLIEYFSNKHPSSLSDGLASDPAKLCFAVKNSIREGAVAASKLLVICYLYAKQKDELSKEDEREIIIHAKTRIPIFMSQLETFLQIVKSTFNNLLPSQRQELASYLVQEIETIFDTISSILIKVKTVLEVILTESEIEETSYQKMSESLEHYTDSVLHRKEVNRLRGVIRRITSILVHSHHKKENIKLMSSGNKIRSVAKDLEQLIVEDLPIFVLWVEEFTSALEEKLKWNESQFCFKVGISKVNEVLKKLVAHKESLQGVSVHLCDLVQRDSFVKSLVAIGLLESSLNPAMDSGEGIQEDGSTNKTSTYQMPKFNTKNSFCVSPPAHRNRLSEAASELLKSERETDMVFEIINSVDSDNVVDPAGEVPVESQTPSSPRPKYCTMVAHRVIVSARCDWFRRALLSGMQESINRKIQVYDTTPHVFSLLLKYLYSGQLDCMSLSVDHLSELLLISDRYELDSLKQVCEYGLKPHLDVDSVIYFFSIADRFNADILKRACEQFIAQHPEVMDNEVFEELPDSLKSEIYDVVICGKPQTTDLPLDKLLSSTACNVEDIEEMIADFHINSNMPSPSTEDLPAQDTSRLEAALERLREVVGQEMSRSQLVQVILAADYDVNRALNFYYSSD